MSVEAMAWALRTSLTGTKKILLIGLANHATAEFDHARPAVATLAVYAGIHERNVQKALRQLEADGWIEATGVHPVEGRRDRAVTVYRLIRERGGADVTASENGVALAPERGGAGAANGVALAPPEPSLDNRPGNRPNDIDRVWERYLEARKAWNPRSTGCRLGDGERRLIREALKVRSLEDVLDAVAGLFRSDWHTDNKYIGISYALRGGGRSPVPGAAIDRMAALANGSANGNGRGLLKSKTYGGRTWDELTRRVQDNLKDSYEMGYERWDGGADDPARPQPAPAHTNGNGRGVTAENWLDDDEG